jgi:hypothetical protein
MESERVWVSVSAKVLVRGLGKESAWAWVTGSA